MVYRSNLTQRVLLVTVCRSASSTLLQTPGVDSQSTQYIFSYFGHTLAPLFARMARLHCICQSIEYTLLLLSRCSWQRKQSYIAGVIVYGVCLQQCYTISYFRHPICQRLRIIELSSPHQKVLTIVQYACRVVLWTI